MASQDAIRDANFVTSLLLESSTNPGVTVRAKGDETTGRLLVDSASGTGTVTSVSVVTANGLAGTVATATTTPAITLSTTITGILSGNGTAISAASTTGTGAVVLATSPALVTPDLGTPTALVGTNITGTAASLTAGHVTTNANLTGVITSSGNATSIASQTGTGTKFVVDNSPTLITPVLGVATATSLAIGGATIGSNGLAVTGHVLIEGVTSTGATGTGRFVFDGTPTLITPVLGVATATSVNGLTITTTTGVLTMTNGKTLAVAKTITLDGTDSTTMTFPSTSATIARTDAAQTFTGTQTFSQVVTTANAITASSNAATIPVTSRHNIVTNDSAGNMTITLTTTNAVNMQTVVVQIKDFSGVAKSITWVNTENSTVTAPTTSNGSTTLPLTVGFIYNAATSLWRCVAQA